MSVTRRDTTVNGNRTQLWTCDDSAPVRRLAAALDRNDDRVERVKSSTVYDAAAWLADETTVAAPDGFVIDSVFNGPNGGTCVRFNEADA